MTALDQALIKAFEQQGRFSVAVTPPSTVPLVKRVPMAARKTTVAAISELETSTSNADDRLAAPEQSRPIETVRIKEAPAPTSALASQPVGQAVLPFEAPSANAVLASLQASPRVPLSSLQSTDRPLAWEQPSSPDISLSSDQWTVSGSSWSNENAQWAIGVGEWAADDSPKTQNPPSPKSFCTPVEAMEPVQLAGVVLPGAPAPEEAAEAFEFKPAWQVDRFTWPRVCRRLMAKAVSEFDRLADAIATANDRGQKVLAISGCRRGEGATTMLLCLARRLGERGKKIVLVDADLGRPRLAKRLGVQPQFGWNDVAGAQGCPLEQTLVEATANRVAVLPLREPSGNDPAEGDVSSLAAHIATLRRHYDVVLVDFGPLEDIADNQALAWAGRGTVDAVLLVQNQRLTSEEQMAEAERRLNAAGLFVAGVIENFVTAGH